MNKEDMIVILQENKKNHIENFNGIKERYLALVIEEAEKQINQAKQGKFPKTKLHFPAPENHAKDYDRAISMLKMDTRNEVELDVEQYQQFVEDDWHWRRSFESTTEFYAGRG